MSFSQQVLKLAYDGAIVRQPAGIENLVERRMQRLAGWDERRADLARPRKERIASQNG
jgi:hypothetical protein